MCLVPAYSDFLIRPWIHGFAPNLHPNRLRVGKLSVCTQHTPNSDTSNHTTNIPQNAYSLFRHIQHTSNANFLTKTNKLSCHIQHHAQLQSRTPTHPTTHPVKRKAATFNVHTINIYPTPGFTSEPHDTQPNNKLATSHPTAKPTSGHSSNMATFSYVNN